ncbi:MAG: hypothetical protein HQ582_33695 [Planctomycetes bacterium]|nr:hypothetical protein [Planctomycetota bacterium]
MADRPIRLQDEEHNRARKCRFCGHSHPDTSFKNKAHAVPEFLGNRSLFSLNECDDCNSFLADNYEDHLGRWSMLPRTLARVKGKRGRTSYKQTSVATRVKATKGGLNIHLPDMSQKNLADWSELQLPDDMKSPSHVPIRAAQALVKMACSVCPVEELAQCERAIAWLMVRLEARIGKFPVLFSFSPGPCPHGSGDVILLRRIVDAAIPHLWCVVTVANYQFQVFVPFCPADDDWLLNRESVVVECPHFPVDLPEGWKFGETQKYVLDWAGTEAVQTTANASFRVIRVPRTGEQ